MSSHYENFEIEDFNHLTSLFEADWKDEAVADGMNWLFVGTSGVHGMSTKLDRWPEYDEFTVLVVRPRLVSCGYGHIRIPNREAYNWLCDRVAETVAVIEQTQLPQTGTPYTEAKMKQHESRWRSHALENERKFGPSEFETLFLAAVEELGELAEAYLERQYDESSSQIQEELDDLAAMMYSMQHQLDTDSS